MIKLYIEKAKDRFITWELALLRASNPTPPMVSDVDEVDDAVIEEGIKRLREARSEVASPEASTATISTLSTSVRGSTSASEATCDHTIPNRQSPSPSASEAPCDKTGVRPDISTSARTLYHLEMRQRACPVLRVPAFGCKLCQHLFAKLRAVKQLLDCDIEWNHELKQLHSSTKRANVSIVFFR